MGSAFVEAALARGDSVTVWNRTLAKATALEAFGAHVADSPAGAVKGAERVHLCLKDDAVVDQVLDDLKPALSPEAIVLDHSTTLPVLTAARGPRLAKEHVNFLHCPVFIGPAAARKSEGIIMVSGPEVLFNKVKPALEQQAQQIVYWGERPDLAAAYKLMGNALIIGLGSLVSDVFSIAAGTGVSAPDALKLLEFFNPGSMLKGRGRRMSQANFEASFELTMARKDVQLMLETTAGRPMAVLPSIAARMDDMIAQGYGDKDYGVIARDALNG